MPYYKFKETDLFYNQIKAHPKKEFFIYDSRIYLDNQSQIVGKFTSSVPNVPPGYASVYEINVDRTSSKGENLSIIGASFERTAQQIENTGLVYPFITKDGSLNNFRTIATSSFNRDFLYGDVVSGSYPLSASITRQFFEASTTRKNSANRINALRNTLDYYSPYSSHYKFSSSNGNKEEQAVNLISVPSIFYGSSIRKGSVNLKFYLTGSLIGELKDENLNGELIQVGPESSTGSGSVAGVVLYNEGFLLLTGSWPLGEAALDYTNENKATHSSWLYYGVGANDGIPEENNIGDVFLSRLSASYNLDFQGTQRTPVVTMYAQASRAELNYSNNPTFIDQSHNTAFTFSSSSIAYVEANNQPIKNTVKIPYNSPTGAYSPQTYISKIGIFDDQKNLIAIAKLATPVKKTEDRALTFKLKLDF